MKKINNIIKKYTTFDKLEDILIIYDGNNLSYHNREHIMSMLEKSKQFSYIYEYDYIILILSIIFHDIIYSFDNNNIPLKDNEISSALFAKENIIDEKIADTVYKHILFTKYHLNVDEFSAKYLVEHDTLRILTYLDFGHLLNPIDYDIAEMEMKIRAEYPNITTEVYKKERLNILHKIRKFILMNNIQSDRLEYSIDKLIEYYELNQRIKL